MKYKNKNNLIATALGGIFVLISVFALSSAAYASEITPENIISVVNNERQLRGLSPLENNPALSNAAKDKSIDMIVGNYFDHYAKGKTPWIFIRNRGYNYSLAGENLAMGFNSAEGVVSAWMNSPAHRANILNPEYEDIGVGVVKGEFIENGVPAQTTITTEMFGKPKSRIVETIERVSDAITKIFNR